MDIFGIGIGEIMVIAVVALIFLGPDRLPEMARSLGKGVAELRRATEPARSAWTDLTSEINTEINKVTTLSGIEKQGNPWQIHPIMEKMTPEERERFMAGGEMPPAVAAEMAQMTLSQAGTGAGAEDDDAPALDYPMPDSEISFQPAPKRLPPMEDLEYPSPGLSNGHTEPAEV